MIMMIQPMISVVVAAFNAERTIGNAINSVLSQVYSDFEIVVCDDASTDDTARLVAAIDDRRICLLRNQHNLGPGPSRDHAIENARGKWITFLDADDQYAPERLGVLLQVAEQYPDDIVSDGLVDCHDTPGGLKPWRSVWGKRYPASNSHPIYSLDFAQFIANERTLIKPFIRKELTMALHASHGNKTSGEDVAFLFPFFANGSVLRYVPRTFYYYRMTPGSLSSSKLNRHAQYREVFESALPLFAHSSVDSAAITAKISSIQRLETYQVFFNALREGRFSEGWAMARKRIWLLTELLRRIMDRIPFHLHRILHNGTRRHVG